MFGRLGGALLMVAGCNPETTRPAPPPEAPAKSAPEEVVAARMDAVEPEPTPAQEEAELEPEPIRVPVVDCTEVKETGYRRGKAFPIRLVKIDHDYVERRTARAYWAMRDAAARDGVPLIIYSAFRSQAMQKYFYRCYRTKKCNHGTRAAPPGHSNHQSGHAIDIGLYEGVSEWLEANAEVYGFRRTVAKEPWHWEYRAGLRPDKSKWPELCPAEADSG